MKVLYPYHKEQGVVSILSVIFFIILMSILTVSFLRIVTDEQTQVENDDLSKGALASAQSGVEDAKRALLYCRSRPSAQQANCYTNIQNQTCPGMFTDPALRTALGLNQLPDGSIQVGGLTNTANQRYTCVTINTETSDIAQKTDENTMQLYPLRSKDTFNQLRFSWRQADETAPNPAIPTQTQVPANTTPRKPQWKNAAGTGYLPVARLQIFNFEHTRTLTDQRDNSAGMFLFPYSGTGTNTLGLPSITPGAIGNKHVATSCGGAISGYLCTMTVSFPAPNPATQEYFLAIKSVYGPIGFKVELLNNGTPVNFDNVQPEIDSTGATSNVYKRILSRVAYQTEQFIPPNVMESGYGICKDFYVTRTTANADSTCLGL